MGASILPTLGSCDFEVLAGRPAFRRGDANDSGAVDLSDAVAILGCKFLGEPCPTCRDAADANDDGLLDISDAIRILGFLFVGAPPPAAPGPALCGQDPSGEDPLPSCEFHSC